MFVVQKRLQSYKEFFETTYCMWVKMSPMLFKSGTWFAL